MKIKHLGDSIDKKDWVSSGIAEKAMKGILVAKFSQVEYAQKVLLSTGNKRLGEANPNKNSMFWSTGFGKGSVNALKPDKWNGGNKLGEILEMIRNNYMK